MPAAPNGACERQPHWLHPRGGRVARAGLPLEVVHGEAIPTHCPVRLQLRLGLVEEEAPILEPPTPFEFPDKPPRRDPAPYRAAFAPHAAEWRIARESGNALRMWELWNVINEDYLAAATGSPAQPHRGHGRSPRLVRKPLVAPATDPERGALCAKVAKELYLLRRLKELHWLRQQQPCRR